MRPVNFLMLGMIIFVLQLTGCGTIYRNYIDRDGDPPAEAEKARAVRGEINVILLQGCATEPGAEDTLFSCLKLSRDVHPESVKLPPGEKIYLGHVSEFILRAFKYYQMEESFKDFYGHRVILKFRKLTPYELRARKFSDYSGIAVGATSTVAGAVTMLPLGVVFFLADGIKTEIDRQDFEDRAERVGLPKPKKSALAHKLKSGGQTLANLKDGIAHALTGKKSEQLAFDEKMTSYIVEECTLETVAPEDLEDYKKRVERFRNPGNKESAPVNESRTIQ